MKNPNVKNFFVNVLGPEGAEALQKAGERSAQLSSVLLPRTLLSWLSFVSRWGYEGEIPGMPDSHLEFHKSAEDCYDGVVTILQDTYEFNNASILQVAAATAVALGEQDLELHPDLKRLDIGRLGKNLDILVGTRLLKSIKKKAEESSESEESSEVDKAEAPGPPNPLKAPTAPTPPLAPTKQQTKGPKTKRKPINILKNQAELPCGVCGDPQFSGSELTMCACLRDLRKATKATPTPNGYLVEFGLDWSDDDIEIFLDMVTPNE